MTTTVYLIQSAPVCFSISARTLCLNPAAYLNALEPTLYYKDDGCCFFFDFLSADLCIARLRRLSPQLHFWLIAMVVEDTDCFDILSPLNKELTITEGKR